MNQTKQKYSTLLILLFIFSICLHILYYISAFSTHTLSPFFGDTTTIGQDFFQIPNGVYAFLHGGTLNGKLPPGTNAYIDCCGVNSNVYHPIFTLLVGYPLQLLQPWHAFSAWLTIHILITITLLSFLWHKFKHHKYIYLALALFLLNSYHYYEIWGNQYHFLLTFFTVLFLYESHTHGDSIKSGIYLLLSLLIKPIALLWLIPLLLCRRFKTALIGYGIFTVSTIILSQFPLGQYYLNNLLDIIPYHFALGTNIYGITYLIPSIPIQFITYLSYAIALALLILQIIKKPPLFTIITLWICYSLLFYPMTFIYQMSTLAGLFCLGILLNKFSPKKFILLPIIFLTLPNLIFIIYKAAKIYTFTNVQWATAWQYIMFWLFLFAATLFWQSWTKAQPPSPETPRRP
jgi:hypothetical protein